MTAPRVRVSLDAWGTLALVMVAVVAFHLYRALDFSRSPVTGLAYYLLLAAVLSWIGLFYYGLNRTSVSETGMTCVTLFGQTQIKWQQIVRAEVLKNGSLALSTTTDRVVIPLLFFSDRQQIADFVLAQVTEAGAQIHHEQS